MRLTAILPAAVSLPPKQQQQITTTTKQMISGCLYTCLHPFPSADACFRPQVTRCGWRDVKIRELTNWFLFSCQACSEAGRTEAERAEQRALCLRPLATDRGLMRQDNCQGGRCFHTRLGDLPLFLTTLHKLLSLAVRACWNVNKDPLEHNAH